ncbi:hypothetical protein FJT64_002993 [Amphibalanus amphitrite]|uniref:Uncharacterized protein n=1 Tax=Amphibalanus amphitrite TaxID=1232801 RepID=A0A6A4W206_AMPAM|nr:hypothetical protein FJT64_002993 [Amphibalanus amphitrite]
MIMGLEEDVKEHVVHKIRHTAKKYSYAQTMINVESADKDGSSGADRREQHTAPPRDTPTPTRPCPSAAAARVALDAAVPTNRCGAVAGGASGSVGPSPPDRRPVTPTSVDHDGPSLVHGDDPESGRLASSRAGVDGDAGRSSEEATRTGNTFQYCSSVWGGASKSRLHRLQRTIHLAVRLVSGLRKFDHITPALGALGWPGIGEVIAHRDAVNVQRALYAAGAPDSLRSMFRPRAAVSNRVTRATAAGAAVLDLPRVRLAATRRLFSYRAAAAWNGLPPEVKATGSRRQLVQHFR